MNNTTKLLLKLLNLFTNTAHQNIFNHSEARESLLYIFQEANTVSVKYLDLVDEMEPKEEQPLQSSLLEIKMSQ